MKIPVWEQLATDQNDPWEVFPRQVFTTYLSISVAFVVLCRVGCLWVIGVYRSYSSPCKFQKGNFVSFVMKNSSFAESS